MLNGPPCINKVLLTYLLTYFCCRAVADTLSSCFTEKCNVEKSSITVLVSDVF